MGKNYVGDIGVRIRTDLESNLTGYSTVKYKIKKPLGTIVTFPCEVEDPLNGIVYYDTVAFDFNEVGIYHSQVEVIFTDGDRMLSETKPFEIFEEYK